MAGIHNTQKQDNKNDNTLGQLEIRAHYRADDGSAELTYSFKRDDVASRSRRDLWSLSNGVYMNLVDPITMLKDMPELYIIKMSVHEVSYDEYGNKEDDYLLEEFGL